MLLSLAPLGQTIDSVAIIEWLDKLEGVAEGLYERVEITLAGSSPRGLTKVSTYILPRANLEPSRDVPIKSGDWHKK